MLLNPSLVIPAWTAGIQVYMDVSGRIRASLDTGNPCRHDGDLHFHAVAERKIMTYSAVKCVG
jgi:hypothetical protein